MNSLRVLRSKESPYYRRDFSVNEFIAAMGDLLIARNIISDKKKTFYMKTTFYNVNNAI